MSFHLAGFGEDQDPAGAFVGIAGLQDDRLTVVADNIRVPSLNNVAMLSGGADDATASRIRLTSPTLDAFTRYEVAPLNSATGDVEPSNPPAIVDLRNAPLKLGVDENLRADILSNPGAAAFQWLMLWFSDGPIAPIAPSNVFTVRGVSATTVTARVWSPCIITLDDELPPGRYQIVGLHAIGATAIAARVILREGGMWRPGCIAADTINDISSPLFRNGQMGVWGEFPFTQLPEIEFLCDVADTAQVVHYDLVRIGG